MFSHGILSQKFFNILELDRWFGPTQALIRIIGAMLIAKMAERIDLQNVFKGRY